jgi:phage antirepressor YoqD-like protein
MTKALKNNFLTKCTILLFSFLLKKKYIIYEDKDKIVLLKKGKEIDLSKVFD